MLPEKVSEETAQPATYPKAGQGTLTDPTRRIRSGTIF